MESECRLLFGSFELDPVNQRLWRDTQALGLTPKAFDVLHYLARNAGRLVRKEELLNAIWGNVCVSNGVLKVRVRELRRVLDEQPQHPRFIETLPRRGYRFIAEVNRAKNQNPKMGNEVLDWTVPSEGSTAAGFIGQKRVFAKLSDYLQQALTGDRQVVFLTGQVGIGKTAMLDAFQESVKTCPQLLWGSGQCMEHFGSAEPYLPVLSALSGLCRLPHAIHLPALLERYAPTWLMQMPWLLDNTDPMQLQRDAQYVNRERMLREMCELIAELSRNTPLVLVLEDLHWSDYATLDLISALARSREPARFMLVGTYRPLEATQRQHPLKAIQQELALHRCCVELPLRFLNVKEVTEFLAQRFPEHAFPANLVQAVHQRTGGNPLFILNVVEQLLSQGINRTIAGDGQSTRDWDTVREAVPNRLQQLIGHQFQQFTAEQQHVLRTASVAGLEFSAATVATILKSSLEAVEQCCDELVRTEQVLCRVAIDKLTDNNIAGRYAFAHALYRDVLYKELPAARRRWLHRAINDQIRLPVHESSLP